MFICVLTTSKARLTAESFVPKFVSNLYQEWAGLEQDCQLEERGQGLLEVANLSLKSMDLSRSCHRYIRKCFRDKPQN